MIDHPLFQKHVIAVYGELLVDCDHIQYRLRWCVDDCPEDEKDNITTFPYEFGNFKNCSEEEMARFAEKGKELGRGEDTFNFGTPPSTNTGITI